MADQAQVKDLKPRGIKAPLHLVPRVLLELYVSALPGDLAPWSEVPSQLLDVAAAAFGDGAAKYDTWNWLHQADMSDMRDTYTGALLRHIHALNSGERCAPDSGVSHIGHAAACAAILGHHLRVSPARAGSVRDYCASHEDRLFDALVYHAHSFADPTTGDIDGEVHHLVYVAYLLGRLAVELDHGYTESTACKAKRGAA